MNRSWQALATVALLASVASCKDSSTNPDQATTYTIEVSGERFKIRTSNAQAIAGLEDRMRTGEVGVILGRVAAGNGGYNQPWSWHLLPNTIEVPDVAIELCDGRPSMVEADLQQWMQQVRDYCPWGATVVSREE